MAGKKHRRYADYDYEETYDMTASSLDEDRIREMLADDQRICNKDDKKWKSIRDRNISRIYKEADR